jgi:hypothetical protein
MLPGTPAAIKLYIKKKFHAWLLIVLFLKRTKKAVNKTRIVLINVAIRFTVYIDITFCIFWNKPD